ncbi:ligand-binding sensor domain-containing protein [Chitinophaga sp. RAB17]|uniref:ligand-binding sensor domain-containing protein n=1 Tax=Chitinophaga sp. RAB17 TaxID=3233049 RepID=UPI003F918FF5
MHRVLIFLLLFICLSIPAGAQQTIGLPDIINYNSLDFHASADIRCIRQGSNGILYMANNDGLLTFNGRYWKLHRLPNKAEVRSVAVDPTGKIYVGGHDEIGYFFPAANGTLEYHSLKHLIPPVDHQFADIWDIIIAGDVVYFRTIESIFELKQNKITFFDAPGGWLMMAWANQQLYTTDRTLGLLTLKNGKWEPACNNIPTTSLRIKDITAYKGDTLLVASLNNGLFLLCNNTLLPHKTSIDPVLQNDRINCARKIADNQYAIGTIGNGLFILDEKGRLFQRFSRSEGLQNNNIFCLFPDKDRNLWLGLENGIDLVNYSTSLRHIYPDKNNGVSGSAITVFNHQLYVGTSNGLFTLPVNPEEKDLSANSGTFTEVAHTKGQVWGLQEVNKQLLMAHQDGAFRISDGQATPLADKQGTWSFLPLSPGANSQQTVIAGAYTGLLLFPYTNGILSDNIIKIDSLYESMRFLATDNNIIWGSHPYRGIFRMELSPDKKKVIHKTILTQKDGLPAGTNNYVYHVKNRIAIATEKGVYEYNATTHKMAPSAYFKPFFKDMPVRFLTEDKEGNIWFVSNQLIGVVDFNHPADSSYFSLIWFPTLPAQAPASPGYIYPYDKENIFICSSKGIYHINYLQYMNASTHLNVLLSSVNALSPKDSLIFGGYTGTAKENMAQLPKQWNSFHFEYTANVYPQKDNVEFSCKLSGFDRDWSDWSPRTEKDYTNLSYGTYTFSVRARNTTGNISDAVSYTFEVMPAWYQTGWAYAAYVLLALGLIFGLLEQHKKRVRHLQQQHATAQKQLNYLHQLELYKNEKEIIALQNDKLSSEVNLKNKELATITMHMVNRGKLVSRIREELSLLLKKTGLSNAGSEFKPILRLLEDAEKGDNDWEQFAAHFDEIHHNFLHIIKKKYPILSATDLKLCAYLKLNLSSKEIAQLMNISVKGVEISRYRLRKKLQLETTVNLFDFLINVTP